MKAIASSAGTSGLMKIAWPTATAVKVGLYRGDLASSISMKTHLANLMNAHWPADFEAGGTL